MGVSKIARISKPPEIRKQEIIDVALALFVEKGYEAVSVRDILKVVNGHPGMFYYYFKSKQEIYNEAMKQMVNREVSKRTQVLQDKSKTVLVRFKELFTLINDGIYNYYKAFNHPDNAAYERTVLLDLLTAMAEPVSHFMLEANAEGLIPPEAGVTEKTAYPLSLFIIHGCHGLVPTGGAANSLDNVKHFIPFISRFLMIPQDLLKK